ncbi:MAG: DUF131 domain-containing protein [Methanosarcinaceae archaeon]|nr:DUF131 domain-containing protein [Methanosarcinaceae archaeon]
MRPVQDAFKIGFILIVVGSLMIFAGTILHFVQGTNNGHFGGLVMIGPIPIVFGSSTEITSTMLVVGLLFLVLYLLMGRRTR